MYTSKRRTATSLHYNRMSMVSAATSSVHSSQKDDDDDKDSFHTDSDMKKSEKSLGTIEEDNKEFTESNRQSSVTGDGRASQTVKENGKNQDADVY